MELQLTKKQLRDRPAAFNEFDGYFALIEIIESHSESKPDIAIETSKALIEGVCKAVFKYTKEELPNNLDLSALVKKAIKRLIELNGDISREFLSATGVVHKMGEVRNARGEVSHGRPLPKLVESSANYAKFIINFTDGLVSSLLHALFNLDMSVFDSGRKVIQYSDTENTDFNLWLDSEYQLKNEVSYSLALFDQNYEAYVEQLNIYRDSEGFEF